MGPIHALALRGAHGRPRKPILAAVSRTTLSLRFQTPWCSCTEVFTYLNLFVSAGTALHLRCPVGCSFSWRLFGRTRSGFCRMCDRVFLPARNLASVVWLLSDAVGCAAGTCLTYVGRAVGDCLASVGR